MRPGMTGVEGTRVAALRVAPARIARRFGAEVLADDRGSSDGAGAIVLF